MKVKILTSWGVGEGCQFPERMDWNGVEFIADSSCREYDWLVVYDEFPKDHPVEELACPPSHTILVTQEPPTIKVYNPIYTNQFRYVLTTQDPQVLRHPGYRRGTGCLVWFNGRSVKDNCAGLEFEKPKLLSAVCSRKKYKHTEHFKRVSLIEYLEQHIPELEWYGWGARPIWLKYEAMDPFKYHLAIENHVHPYHWTEKLSDSFLSLCLPFYAGDPELERVLPADSFIRIPIDNPPEALRIIKEAIAADEYTKRLPAIREARRLIVERYNLWAQVLGIIAEHEQARYGEPPEEAVPGTMVKDRHILRRNPINLLRAAWYSFKIRLSGGA